MLTTRLQNRAMLLVLAVLVAMAITDIASAATLEWTLPTERENGEALAPAAIDAVKIYRGTAIIATLPGTATTYGVPSCSADSYTATATASGLESAHSASAEVAIDRIGCRPKPPGGVKFR